MRSCGGKRHTEEVKKAMTLITKRRSAPGFFLRTAGRFRSKYSMNPTANRTKAWTY